MRKEALQALEFVKILEAAAAHSLSEPGRERVLALRPLARRGDIARRFGEVADIRRLQDEGAPLALAPFTDVREALRKSRPRDAVLDPLDIYAFAPLLRIIEAVREQAAQREDLTHLRRLAEPLTGFPGLLSAVEASVDAEGNILDGASYVLEDLRGRIRSLERKIMGRLEELLRDPGMTPFLQDGFVTRRYGRWVIPVRMDARGMVSGVVHDVSRTGETAFVEPLEIMSRANELENLTAEARAEEIRILRSITSELREAAPELEAQFETVVELDAQNAVALFAQGLGAAEPEINEESLLKVDEGRHPLLLMLPSARKGEDVVPLTLSLGGGQRVMVITGPNAGGKTIAIKTAGLLVAMALSGIPVPARPSSSFPLVEDLLLDIGDEQSIEESLSTFSAHIANLAGIVKSAGPRSLVLIDELGTGTNPVEGAALGSAVLQELGGKGSLVLATTHLVEIVGFVHKTEGMVNASMEFEEETLTPLYRLRPGEPGESHALEIARRYGLPASTIERATSLVGRTQAELHGLLRELKEARRRYEEELLGLERLRAEVEEERKALSGKLREAERERKRALEEAYRQAGDILAEASRQARDALAEARKERRAALRRLEERKAEVAGKLRELRPETRVSLEEIEPGDTIHVRTLGYDARVVAVDREKERVRVKVRDREVEVPAHALGPRKKRELPPRVRYVPEGEEEEAPSAELNMVGRRVEEALSLLEPFLNRASLGGLREVTVIHGIGTGALRKAVREHLAAHPLVAEFRPGTPAEGGEGVTVVSLR
ncbi:MAG: endonuclease MutS2 [Nitrospirota bacterium]|jgi:DNA mismatch repair protein MutS2